MLRGELHGNHTGRRLFLVQECLCAKISSLDLRFVIESIVTRDIGIFCHLKHPKNGHQNVVICGKSEMNVYLWKSSVVNCKAFALLSAFTLIYTSEHILSNTKAVLIIPSADLNLTTHKWLNMYLEPLAKSIQGKGVH